MEISAVYTRSSESREWKKNDYIIMPRGSLSQVTVSTRIIAQSEIDISEEELNPIVSPGDPIMKKVKKCLARLPF